MPSMRCFQTLSRVCGVLLFFLSSCGTMTTPPASTQTVSIPAKTETTSTPEWERAGWTLVWQDEFDGEALDPENWMYEFGGGGWGNHELENYTDRPENLRLKDGMLVIEAKAEEYLQNNYTSARIKTQGLHAWTYGRIETRAKLPYGNGIWPAFWMLGSDIGQAGWPSCGEIDIMEHIGRNPTQIYGTVHGPGYSGAGGVGSPVSPSESVSELFHTYAIEWEPAQIRWYVDDVQYFQVTPGELPGEWVYDHPFFIILNLAIGGDWPGYPDETTLFPQRYVIDYVRVYQRSGQVDSSQSQTGAMHLGEIVLNAQANTDGTWQAVATISVVNESGVPIQGAQVTGGWVGIVVRGEMDGETDSTGKITLTSAATSRAGKMTFCITNVTHSMHLYDKSANTRNCGSVEH